MTTPRVDSSGDANNKGLKEMSGEEVNQTFVHLIHISGSRTVHTSIQSRL